MKQEKRMPVSPQAYLAGAAFGNFGNLFSALFFVRGFFGCSPLSCFHQLSMRLRSIMETECNALPT
jgi:hypothetical protein